VGVWRIIWIEFFVGDIEFVVVKWSIDVELCREGFEVCLGDIGSLTC
jgi:hypothetical protein